MRIALSDGSLWPRPYLESDESTSAAWRAIHTPQYVTKEDLLELASVADAYGHLIMAASRRRNFVCKEIQEYVGGD